MRIVKFEEFHVDCGWEIYSFLKISTDKGVTGWSNSGASPPRHGRHHGMARC